MKEYLTQVYHAFIFFKEIVEIFSPKIALIYSHNCAPPELMPLIRQLKKKKSANYLQHLNLKY